MGASSAHVNSKFISIPKNKEKFNARSKSMFDENVAYY